MNPQGPTQEELTRAMTPENPPVTQSDIEKREATKAQIRRLQQELREREAKNVSGAASLTPKTQMLDAKAIEEQNPEYHYRYVNIMDPAKSKVRRNRGYVPVSDEEAQAAGVDVRHGSELVLMKIPREEFERREEELEALNKARLDAHKAEVQKAAEAIVRELKDQHGLDYPLDRVLVSE